MDAYKKMTLAMQELEILSALRLRIFRRPERRCHLRGSETLRRIDGLPGWHRLAHFEGFELEE